MSLNQRLDIRQQQTLVMTPQLQQAIKLLQMSNQELSEFVEQEIENNPLLEREDGADGADNFEEAAPVLPEAGEPEPLSGDNLDSVSDQSEDWNDYNTPESDSRLNSSGGHADDDFYASEAVAERPGLRDHLLSQIHIDIIDPVERMIAVALLEMIDDAGYLPSDLDLVRVQIGAAPAVFQQVIERMQRFDPSGICARSLTECLAIQLRDKNRLDPAMDKLLKNLDLVAKHERNALMKICQVDAEDLADMLAEIRLLNPKPALSFNVDVTQPIVPDVALRPMPGGGWHVELNNDTLPRVLANERYYTRIQGGARTKSDKDYLSERWQQANWLVKALNQRATTILKVASEIVRQQDQFFVSGVQYLKPLVLRDIATAVEMHESTVSRVTQNKYISTPRGLFELKYFFTTALSRNDTGDMISSEAVRSRIQALIDGEDPKNILSDDRLAQILSEQGIEVARRTVAKYREALDIPTSSQRRRIKADSLISRS